MSFSDLIPTKLTLDSGVELHYVRAGTGPVLIMIHGAMGDWRSWSPQWDSFVGNYDCIAYSRRYSHPNHNDMPSPDHGAFVDAEDLIGMMDALGIERAILVGSSYGAFTALAVAATAPDRVIAIAGVEPPMMRYAEMDPKGADIAAQFRTETVLPARLAFAAGDDEQGATLLTAGIGGRQHGTPPAHIMKARMQNAKAARMLSLSSDEFPLIPPETLASLKMPILLMSGANTAPVHAAIFAGVTRHMPQIRTKIVTGSGHSVSRQQPEVFNTEVLDFLATALAT